MKEEKETKRKAKILGCSINEKTNEVLYFGTFQKV